MIEYRIGDYVGAQNQEEWNKDAPVFGRIESWDGGWFVRTGDQELTGPWSQDEIWPDPSAHVDYPHHPGTLHDCPACEASGLLEYVSESSTTSTELDRD